MKIKRIAQLAAASFLSVSSLMVLNFGGALAVANNCAWTGAGDGSNFSDATNWSSCGGVAPQAGDNLVFNIASLGSGYKTIHDNISNLSVNNITFQGNNPWTNNGGAGDFYGLIVDANNMTISGDVTNSATTSVVNFISSFEFDNNITFSGNPTLAAGTGGGVDFAGTIAGSGSITTTGAAGATSASLHTISFTGANSTFSGTITANSGTLSNYAAGAIGTAAVTVNDGADMSIGICGTAYTFSNNLTLNGASSVPSGAQPVPKLTVGSVCAGGVSGDEVFFAPVNNNQEFTLTGSINLQSDITFGGLAKTTTLTGALSGAHKMTLPGQDYGGTLVINGSSNTSSTPNGTYTPIRATQTLSDSVPSHTIFVGTAYTVSIDGVRGDTTVGDGGILEGSGTVGNLDVQTGGTEAPGHSPGCMNTGNLTLSGNYQVQIGGTLACSGYDQTNVTGTVDVSGGTLDTTLYNNYKPKAGETYTIIKNDGSDAVTGTLTGLAEGATFNVSGYVFKVSYTGGDGNDVVLSVVSVPKTPDTGFGLISNDTGMTLGISILSALAIAGIAKQSKKRDSSL